MLFRLAGFLLALTSSLLAPTAPALAAEQQQFGDLCVANGFKQGVTAVALDNRLHNGEFLPLRVPLKGSAVITRWKVNAPSDLAPTRQRLVAFKSLGPENYLRLGESSMQTVTGGAANEFSTRIPVSHGDVIGLHGHSGALLCTGIWGQLVGFGSPHWANGKERKVKLVLESGVPVIATVEPDRNGDGYGDITQDRQGKAGAGGR
jgi:hypothetical protein